MTTENTVSHTEFLIRNNFTWTSQYFLFISQENEVKDRIQLACESCDLECIPY